MNYLSSSILNGSTFDVSFEAMQKSYRKPEENKLASLQSNDLQIQIEDTEKKAGLCLKIRKLLRSIFIKEKQPRTIKTGKHSEDPKRFCDNTVSNTKYSIITFVPYSLWDQFKYFLNFFFLLCACTQFVPQFQVGQIWTYWAPLVCILVVTMAREAYDDIQRWRRDREVNGTMYWKLVGQDLVAVKASDIRVGDIVSVGKNQRVPADLLLVRTTESAGSCFIRTDQLDGETDWKMRIAMPTTQAFEEDADLVLMDAEVYAEKPQKDIYNFLGTFRATLPSGETSHESVSTENMLWANTVVASGTAIGVCVYTGDDTRAVLNTSQPRSKHGKLDDEVNTLTKILFTAVMIVSMAFIIREAGGKNFKEESLIYFVRFVNLLSYIIPVSLRVNLDMAKIAYSSFIHRDRQIPETIVRSSTLPEELGRIHYLLSDKTGTLTQNVMVFKRLHLGTVCFTPDTMDDVKRNVEEIGVVASTGGMQQQQQQHRRTASRDLQLREQHHPPNRRQVTMRRTVDTRVVEAVKAIAICHNVTPVYEEAQDATLSAPVLGDRRQSVKKANGTVNRNAQTQRTYQASSPDEVALVEWCETVGLVLEKRDRQSMTLRTSKGIALHYEILHVFPFKSETKRMGIVVRNSKSGEISFYVKGADIVMARIVKHNDWLTEETDNMAREGLRTLVVGRKVLNEEAYKSFVALYNEARMAVEDRNEKVDAAVETLEKDLELLCLTGVEDKLQDDVRQTLERMRNAGVRIWMLTGDKLETAMCIAKSSRLVSPIQEIHAFTKVTRKTEAKRELARFSRKEGAALIVEGESLERVLASYESEFMALSLAAPAVIICRCSPTQKAIVVNLVKSYAKKRTCAIGDGGNDVSMIQAADIGIGIVGKEGKQASMAADFSITKFCYMSHLLLWHGRNSYKRSANMAQFIIHRGLVIGFMQLIFSATVYPHLPISVFPSFLMVGFTTFFTQLPVLALILNRDVTPKMADDYPELYKELTKARVLTFKTFLGWTLVSIFEASVIMYGGYAVLTGAKKLFSGAAGGIAVEYLKLNNVTFTVLLLSEFVIILLTVEKWHYFFILSQLLSFLMYVCAIALMEGAFNSNYFSVDYFKSGEFYLASIALTLISIVPLSLLLFLRRKLNPPIYTKLK